MDTVGKAHLELAIDKAGGMVLFVQQATKKKWNLRYLALASIHLGHTASTLPR